MNLTDNLNSKELRLNYNNDGFSRASALRPLIQITFEETTFSKVLFTAAMVLLRSPCVSANKIRRTQAAADCNCCKDKEWRKQIVNQSLGVRKKISVWWTVWKHKKRQRLLWIWSRPGLKSRTLRRASDHSLPRLPVSPSPRPSSESYSKLQKFLPTSTPSQTLYKEIGNDYVIQTNYMRFRSITAHSFLVIVESIPAIREWKRKSTAAQFVGQ